MRKRLKHLAFTVLLGGGSLILSACEPVSGVYVSGGVYYDSVLWNDYYRPRPPQPPVVKPPRPPRPTPPIARPPRPTPPIHRAPRPGRPR